MRARSHAPQGGPAVHPRPGTLRRRRAVARHAAPGDPAVAGGARAGRADRHHGRAGAPEGRGGRHRRRSRREGPGVDADSVERRAGGARDGQGPVPGAGGGVRRCRGPVLGARRARADRRRVRDPGPGDRRPPSPRRGRPRHPHRPGRQDRQPLLRLGDGRFRRHRCRVRQGRRGGTAGDGLPARASGADGDVRRGRRLRRRRRQAHAVVDQPGPARAPHAVRAGRRVARAQDPGGLAGHRRRFRQQGTDLPGLRVRHRRVAAHRQTRQVDGGS